MSWAKQGYVYATAAIFGVAGFGMLLTAWDHALIEPVQQQPDAVLGLQTRTLLLLAGLAFLASAVVLVVCRGTLIQGLFLLWVSCDQVVYRIGMISMKASAPFPALQLVGWKSGIRAHALDKVWQAFIAWLVIGGLVLVIAGYRQSKLSETESYISRWRKRREESAASGPRPRRAS